MVTKRVFFNKEFDRSLFSGIVLWEEGKRIFDAYKDFLKEKLAIAFAMFLCGIRRAGRELAEIAG